MAYTNRFQKKGCKAVKDIDFKKISSLAKVTVPTMVVSSFQKQVAPLIKANQPFDVTVDVDVEAGKARLIVKNGSSKDIKLEWTERTGAKADAAKGLIKVKAQLSSFAITNKTYLKKIVAVQQEVKKVKDEIKQIEASLPTGFVDTRTGQALAKKISAARDALTDVRLKGSNIFDEHTKWYLSGPRRGVSPLLKANNIEEQDLDKSDAEALLKELHGMSVAAGEVKKIYDINIDKAVDALLTRLSNIEAMATKSSSAALTEIIKNLTGEVAKIRQFSSRAMSELKIEKTTNLMNELKDDKSRGYQRFATNPKFIATEVESNNTRIGLIPKYRDGLTKQCVRIMKGLPMSAIKDERVRTLARELEAIDKANKDKLGEALKTLEACNKALAIFRASL